MTSTTWNELRLDTDRRHDLWEIFHENSKTSRFEIPPGNDEVVAHMRDTHESTPYPAYPSSALPREWAPLRSSLEQVLTGRTSARELAPGPVQLDQLAALLFYAYGVTRDNQGTSFVRAFRTVPSAGGLYPLDLYFHSARVAGLAAGIYHYDPLRHAVALLSAGDHGERIAAGLVQPEIAKGASLLVFVTAVFERTVFKYGDRGYRFALLEAGHVAQNLNLAAGGIGFGAINLGGFLDRQMDQLLGLDGVTQSTLYLCAIGGSC